MELVDPELGLEFNKEEVHRMIKVALLCTNPSPALRPTMTSVVSMLEGKTVVDELARDPSIYGHEWSFNLEPLETNLVKTHDRAQWKLIA
ncbi:putative lrr receptor-like serine/threonine-protein kinase [Quercus suber]|uniref:Lrr receptor-like serine/threonine-protein kinase n=1 Tax=Quercus suber TaxID=58331 RepID=A0AAW0LSE1_QUESU|nr:isoform 2 of probable lrr receptor-like serine/threonine-protein kinase [Quercus suber]